MGKASSNKKVARAAGTGGGRTAGGRISWGYYGVILIVVILGVAGTVASRHRFLSQQSSSGGTPPTIGTTWDEAYAVDICGKIQPNIDSKADPAGIRTQDDGIIHIRPTSKKTAGKNATLGAFADAVGMKLNAGEIQLPGGTLHRAGDDCGGKRSGVYVKQFPFVGATSGTIARTDPRDVHLTDQGMLTIAFVPVGQTASIPAPPKAVQTALSKLGASTSTSTTAPAGSATTTPSTTAPSSATTTAPSTTAPATTTTTAPSSTTTTKPASSTTSP